MEKHFNIPSSEALFTFGIKPPGRIKARRLCPPERFHPLSMHFRGKAFAAAIFNRRDRDAVWHPFAMSLDFGHLSYNNQSHRIDLNKMKIRPLVFAHWR
jgi:hypothetical protein